MVTKIFSDFFEKGVDKPTVVCYNVQVAQDATCQRTTVRYSAGVAELADARDLKSRVTRVTYRFETGHRHHTKYHNIAG